MKTDSVTLTDKSKSHKKVKYVNSDQQTVTDKKTDQETVKQTMINEDRQCDIDRQKQIS